jgi:hypothetical protein
MKDKLQEKGFEKLEDVRFWLAVLKKFDGFSEPEKEKIDKAYCLISEIYESKPYFYTDK